MSAKKLLDLLEQSDLLDKALLACDELTGFIGACCLVRPDGVRSLKPKSVKKKLKNDAEQVRQAEQANHSRHPAAPSRLDIVRIELRTG